MLYVLWACFAGTCYPQADDLYLADCQRRARLGDVRVYTDSGVTSSIGYRFTCRPQED